MSGCFLCHAIYALAWEPSGMPLQELITGRRTMSTGMVYAHSTTYLPTTILQPVLREEGTDHCSSPHEMA